jgi:hypothetical protein
MEPSDEPAGTTYVQVAAHVMFDGASLTLLGLAPATVFLAPSAGSEVGYLPTGMFLDHWYAEDSGTRTRWVSAVLSFLDPGRALVSDVDVMVSLPRIRGTGVEYQVRDVVGHIPADSGAAVLFIGSGQAPMTPGSVDRTDDFHRNGGAAAPPSLRQ